MIVVMPDKMNGENHSLVRLFLKSGFMKELDLTKGSVLKTLLRFAVPFLIPAFAFLEAVLPVFAEEEVPSEKSS